MALTLQDSSFVVIPSLICCHPERSRGIYIKNMGKDKEILEGITEKEYEHGFVTDVEQEFIPKEGRAGVDA